MRLPWSYDPDLEARQLLYQGQRGDVRDPLVALVWQTWGQKKKKAFMSTAAKAGAQAYYYYNTLNTAHYLSRMVFDSRDSLVQPQLVEFIVSTC